MPSVRASCCPLPLATPSGERVNHQSSVTLLCLNYKWGLFGIIKQICHASVGNMMDDDHLRVGRVLLSLAKIVCLYPYLFQLIQYSMTDDLHRGADWELLHQQPSGCHLDTKTLKNHFSTRTSKFLGSNFLICQFQAFN